MDDGYDIIGDIHGESAKLEGLLEHLGYRRRGETRRHPGGRKVVFLGDFIDRGSGSREVLHRVRGMVEAGDALAVMGNHEYNAICFHTPDGQGGYLRRRSPKNLRQHGATLRAFEGRGREWADWLGWMGQLPMALDFGEFRVAHACWDGDGIEVLADGSLEDKDFLLATCRPGAPEHRAVETVLKGPEIELPEGRVFHDKEGVGRRAIRARWWDVRPGATYGDLAMPTGMDLGLPVAPEKLVGVPNYPADAPPAFCGHYWLPPEHPRKPLGRNVVCLDFSAVCGGPLVAYRWDGGPLDEANFVHE